LFNLLTHLTQYREIYLARAGNINVPGTARQGKCAVRAELRNVSF